MTKSDMNERKVLFEKGSFYMPSDARISDERIRSTILEAARFRKISGRSSVKKLCSRIRVKYAITSFHKFYSEERCEIHLLTS